MPLTWPTRSPIALDALETPIPLVDLAVLEANLARVSEYASRHGIGLRPHVKTHKSPVVAAAQLASGAPGLTCATLREAEVMATVCDDLLIAYPPVGPTKLERLFALPPTVRLRTLIDGPAVLAPLAARARAEGRTIGILVELDVGMRRTGAASDAAAVALARQVAATPGLRFDGIGCYPGHIREAVAEQEAALEALKARLQTTIATLRRDGLEPAVVSAGSTPALFQTHRLECITEMRPGTYVYNDRTTAVIGACAMEDCALTILATVVSTSVAGQAVIDAGTKALGREPLRGGEGEGYGVLLDRPEVVVTRMSEEHGVLDLSRTEWRPAVGDRVRVVPNHVCVSVAQYDAAAALRGGRVVSGWSIERGR